jgi:hypothetical protein
MRIISLIIIAVFGCGNYDNTSICESNNSIVLNPVYKEIMGDQLIQIKLTNCTADTTVVEDMILNHNLHFGYIKNGDFYSAGDRSVSAHVDSSYFIVMPPSGELEITYKFDGDINDEFIVYYSPMYLEEYVTVYDVGHSILRDNLMSKLN